MLLLLVLYVYHYFVISKYLHFSRSFWHFLTNFLAVSHSVFGCFSLSFWHFLTQFIEVSNSVLGRFQLSFGQFLTQFLVISQINY